MIDHRSSSESRGFPVAGSTSDHAGIEVPGMPLETH